MRACDVLDIKTTASSALYEYKAWDEDSRAGPYEPVALSILSEAGCDIQTIITSTPISINQYEHLHSRILQIEHRRSSD